MIKIQKDMHVQKDGQTYSGVDAYTTLKICIQHWQKLQRNHEYQFGNILCDWVLAPIV